jgi:hypothetical protein
MIVLDTHVVSDAMKPEPDATVRAWLNNQAAETLYLSTVTRAELLLGIGSLQRTSARTCCPAHSIVCWRSSTAAFCLLTWTQRATIPSAP